MTAWNTQSSWFVLCRGFPARRRGPAEDATVFVVDALMSRPSAWFYATFVCAASQVGAVCICNKRERASFPPK